MNLALSDIELPVRLRFERSLTDDELLPFCAVNATVDRQRRRGRLAD
jgi:P2-related tail formation protein